MKYWKQQFNPRKGRKINMRTLEVIQNEHNQIMFQIGVERYRVQCSEKNIEQLLVKALAINEEGAAAMKEQKENESKLKSNGSGNETKEEVASSGGIQEAVPAAVEAASL